MKTCTDCRYCICADYGYSNYTVEGTDVDCLLGKNAGMPSDKFYGRAECLGFAETCDTFMAGDCIEVDCDQEDGALENYSDDADLKELLREYSK
jgi:hypothetical protein